MKQPLFFKQVKTKNHEQLNFLLQKMKHPIIALLISLLFSQITYSQNIYNVSVHITNYDKEHLFWGEIYGDEITITDTLFSDNNTDFTLSLPEGQQTGIYRIIIKKKERDKFIDVVFHNSDIEISTDAKYPLEALKIIQSEETKRYHLYKSSSSYISYKTKLLTTLLESYPQEDPFYNTINIKLNDLKTEQNDSAFSIIDKFPDSYVSKIIAFDIEPETNPALSRAEQQDFLKAHYFDEVDFSESEILHSHAIPNKIINYLALYRNPALYKTHQESLFMQATDTILLKTKINPEIYDFTANYLIEGFKRYGFEKLVTYIATNTDLDLNCSNDEKKAEFLTKIENIKATAIGATAPQIILPDIAGQKVNLHKIDSEYTLVVFWASWCTHCTEMLPELQNLYDKNKNHLKILAVSLDSDSEEWIEASKQFPWTHISELKGWESSIAEKYVVYATPTFFLLNSKKEIIAKPTTMEGILDLIN